MLDTKGFEEIRNYFDQVQSIKISNYVLVMDCYSYSLKDLLERPLKSNDPRNGYEVLRELPHDLRVREVLIILTNVAFGLYQLHNVDNVDDLDNDELLCHQDIKPGNIFIKEISADEFRVALGDLGNLPVLLDSVDPNVITRGSLFAPPDHDYAPGTQHYRSPEQKYYMDVADVQVKHMTYYELDKLDTPGKDLENFLSKGEPDSTPIERAIVVDDQEKRVVLIVKDPKFKNTLIEPHDIVIFSKDTKRERRMITKCYAGNDQSGYFAFMLSNVITDPILAEDDKTQVEFYKKQRHRTDLFGIGAVAFDMITAGWSPEKFYESIRKFETMSVEDIIKRYDTLRRGEIEGENPDLSQIFAPFRNDKDPSKRYPDNDIIKFILKCMLYQAPGTFYQENEKEPRKASRALNDEMRRLLNEYKNRQLLPSELSDKSILIHRPKFSIEPIGQSHHFDQEIAKLQGLAPWPEVDELEDYSLMAANRLLYGAYYFSQIVELVRTKISLDNVSEEPHQKAQGDPVHLLPQHSPYLIQILPTYISIKWEERKVKLDFDSAPSWQSYKTFLKELRDNRLEQLIRSVTNPFVPNGVAEIFRDIRLFVHPNQKQEPPQANSPITCNYRFRDASLFRLTVNRGDWFIAEEQLWEVIDTTNGHNTLTISLKTFEDEARLDKGLAWTADGYVDGTCFLAMDPFKYYLDMLGIYLQHLLFAYSPITTTTRDRIDINALLNLFEIDPPVYIQPPHMKSTDEQNFLSRGLDNILTNFVHLFLMLTLHKSKDSYYSLMVSKKKNLSGDSSEIGTEVLNAVKKYTENQYELILRMLKRQDISSDYPRPITTLNNLSEVKKMVDNLVNEPFDIERTIKRSGLVAWEIEKEISQKASNARF